MKIDPNRRTFSVDAVDTSADVVELTGSLAACRELEGLRGQDVVVLTAAEFRALRLAHVSPMVPTTVEDVVRSRGMNFTDDPPHESFVAGVRAALDYQPPISTPSSSSSS